MSDQRELVLLRAALQRIADEPSSTPYTDIDGCMSTAMDGTQRMHGIARDALGLQQEDGVCPSCFSGMFWDDEQKSCSRCGHGGAEIVWIEEKMRRSQER